MEGAVVVDQSEQGRSLSMYTFETSSENIEHGEGKDTYAAARTEGVL